MIPKLKRIKAFKEQGGWEGISRAIATGVSAKVSRVICVLFSVNRSDVYLFLQTPERLSS